MATVMDATETKQVYRVFIQASPEAIWDAITKPEWNERYGYRSKQEFVLHPGGAYRGYGSDEMGAMAGNVIVDGEILEVDPPNRLVQTWRATWIGEGFTRLTYEIAALQGGVSSLTVIHELEGAPGTAAQVAGAIEGAGGGWAEILSDLKTLLETGKPLYS
jgi:uncharacterized protein YndB with AHSA1/START domain